MISRRQFFKLGAATGLGLAVSGRSISMRQGRLSLDVRRALAATQGPGLSDPAMQPKFQTVVPNALDPGFIFDTGDGAIRVGVGQTMQQTGLLDSMGKPASTTVWGYGQLTGNPNNPKVPGLGFT
ncbi:MAG: hypothetical protein ACK2UU_10930, partial [Anaerolineae bacterium]